MEMDPFHIRNKVTINISFCNYAPENASARPIDPFDFEFLHHPARAELGRVFHRVRIDGFMNSIWCRNHEVCCHDDEFFSFRITRMTNTQFVRNGYGFFQVKGKLFTYVYDLERPLEQVK